MSLPNCVQCQHYYITHDPQKPYGCRAMGFKSRTNPARMVFLTSGLHCQLFSAKKRSEGNSDNSNVA